MLMYIDFGGISLLKKCQNKLGQCPKERCFFSGMASLSLSCVCDAGEELLSRKPTAWPPESEAQT